MPDIGFGHDAKAITSEAAYLRLALAHLNRHGRAVVRVPLGYCSGVARTLSCVAR